MRVVLAAALILLPLGARAIDCDHNLDCDKGWKCVDNRCVQESPSPNNPPPTPPPPDAVEPRPPENGRKHTSRTCAFLSGPRAGEVLYLPEKIYPQFGPFNIGDPCTDGFASHGYAVADSTRRKEKKPSRDAGLSRACRFTSGPLIGTTVVFAEEQYPDYRPVPVGESCSDGGHSMGIAVAPPEKTVAPAPAPPGTSRTCRFTTGPRAGETQYFAPAMYPDFVPQPTGSQCQDSSGSYGFMMKDTASPGDRATANLSRTCRFTAGPRTGQVQTFSPEEYPDMASLPVGTPCGDGVSVGVIIAESTNKDALPPASGLSRTCRYTMGARTGQVQYFPAKLFPDLPDMPLGATCSDGQGNTGIVVPDQ